MSYTDVFGGAVTYPAQVSYQSLVLTADVQLRWPTEAPAGVPVAARIIDLQASVAGRSIILPDSREAAPGEQILFNNVGGQPVSLRNATGGTILSMTGGVAYVAYLFDNSTLAGQWRITVLGAFTSTADAGSLVGPGITAIGSALSQEQEVSYVTASRAIGIADRANALVWASSGGGSLSLGTASDYGNGFFVGVRNASSGALSISVSNPALSNIDGLASVSLAPGESCFVVADGVNQFYTIGRGNQQSGLFTFLSIDVSGSGNYVLSVAETGRIAYRFTGPLTGAREIVVPTTVQEYWIDNATTGAFALSVRTSVQASPGVNIPQNTRLIAYSDGNSVVLADTSVSTFPITIVQGGTGANNANSALINLGGTAVGRAVFTAVDAAAGRTALDATSPGDVIALIIALGG